MATTRHLRDQIYLFESAKANISDPRGRERINLIIKNISSELKQTDEKQKTLGE